jgi:hypothetical protein
MQISLVVGQITIVGQIMIVDPDQHGLACATKLPI